VQVAFYYYYRTEMQNSMARSENQSVVECSRV
jgi:hypothetical protein